MALPQKKYEGSQSKLWIVEKEKTKSKNVAFVVGILLVLVFVLFVLQRVVTNSSEKPESELIEASGIDWNNPPCLPNELSSDWENVTPEKMLQNSNRQEFRHKKTGLKIAFDKGVVGKPNYRGKNHWHIYNPNTINRHDVYLDKTGKPIGEHSSNSHITPECN